MEALKKYNIEEEEDKLFSFLLLMADEHFGFLRAARSLGYELTNPPHLETLETLERYIKEENVSFRDQSDQALDERTNCWYYLGELVRTNFGGQWRFSMSGENTANWGKYVIEGHSPVPGVEFEPQGQVRRFIGNGYKTGALRRAIMSHVTIDDEDFLADLPTETDPNDPAA